MTFVKKTCPFIRKIDSSTLTREKRMSDKNLSFPKTFRRIHSHTIPNFYLLPKNGEKDEGREKNGLEYGKSRNTPTNDFISHTEKNCQTQRQFFSAFTRSPKSFHSSPSIILPSIAKQTDVWCARMLNSPDAG